MSLLIPSILRGRAGVGRCSRLHFAACQRAINLPCPSDASSSAKIFSRWGEIRSVGFHILDRFSLFVRLAQSGRDVVS